MKMKPPTPLAEMTPERLNAELMVSLRQMLAHESWRFGDCKRKCEQPWPCPDFSAAAKRFIQVAQLLGLPR
jgi:hypothetical protein